MSHETGVTKVTGQPIDEAATGCDGCEQAKLTAQLDAEESLRAHDRLVVDNEGAAVVALDKSEWDLDHELSKIFHQTVADVAKSSVDRSRDSAKFVQIAASAIAGLYTGILAYAFAAKDHPLPFRGVWSMLFLGLSIALATTYLAFITTSAQVPWYTGGSSLEDLQRNRTNQLVSWTRGAVSNKSWALRASVVSLAVGVAFMAAPFISYAASTDSASPPKPPTIPRAVPGAVQDEATWLFRSQVRQYRATLRERNAAAKAKLTAASDAPDHERDANRWSFAFALLGGLLVILIPAIAAHYDPD